MTDPYPPYSSQPPPIIRKRKGLGCFATGCLIVVIILMLFGVFFGSLAYVIYHGGQSYISEAPSLAKTVTATDEQYQAVLAKLAPFGQALNEGRAATLEITPDDLNVLIARSPQFESLRGRLFLAAEGDQLIADTSFPVNDDDAHKMYFNGHATLDGSYASNGFVISLRHIEPLDKSQANTLFSRFLNSQSVLQAFSQQLSHGVNEDFRKQSERDPATADLSRRLRTIVVHDGKIEVAIGENPGGPAATPTATPTASPVAADDNQT